MTREGQTTQWRRAGTTGSLRHGGRPHRWDTDRREPNMGPTQGRLRRDLHAIRRDRVRRGIEWILDDDADPVGIWSGRHRELRVAVPSGGVRTAHAVVEVLFMDRKSRSQSQHGLEEVQGLGIIPGELRRLELLDAAE